MGLGYLIASWFSRWNLPNKVSLTQKILVGIIECFLLFLLYKWTIIKVIPYFLPVIILVFTSLFILFLAQRGFLSRMLNNNICFQLGKYSFSAYMIQEIFFNIAKKYIWPNPDFGVIHHPVLSIFAVIFLICIFGVIVYYIIEKPFYKIIKNLNK